MLFLDRLGIRNPMIKLRAFSSKNLCVTQSDVAQICNLLYRRIVFGSSPQIAGRPEWPAPGGLQIRDTAECNSALRWLRRQPRLASVPIRVHPWLNCIFQGKMKPPRNNPPPTGKKWA